MSYLQFRSNEERRNANELQLVLPNGYLSQHEAIKEVLSQVKGLTVKCIHLTYLNR